MSQQQQKPQRAQLRTERMNVQLGLTDGTTMGIAYPWSVKGKDETPVLVVPESAVKGCKHETTGTIPAKPLTALWCKDCGAIQLGSEYGRGRWQRPRILRVPR